MRNTWNLSRPRSGGASRRGASLVAISLAIAALAVLSLGVVSVSLSQAGEQRGSKQDLEALYIAEAGVSDALLELSRGNDGTLGSEQAPLPFGRASYWVERADLGPQMFALTSSAVTNRGGARVEVVLRRESSAFFRWGAFGDQRLTMDSNARVDSYDSSLGPYAAQALNGSGSSAYAREDGDVGSNGNVEMSQNSKVHGDVVPGPTSVATVLGNAVVTGGTTPAPEPTEMPELEIPDFGSSGDLAVANQGVRILPAGDVEYDDLRVGGGGTLIITGPARVVVENLVLRSGARIVVNAAQGPVDLYVHKDFVMNSNTLISSATMKPADVRLHLKSDNIIDPDMNVQLDELGFESNSKLYGTIYAPQASVDIRSNFELFGSLVAKRVNLSSNALVHFDEDLIRSGDDGSGGFTRVCWRELPFRPD